MKNVNENCEWNETEITKKCTSYKFVFYLSEKSDNGNKWHATNLFFTCRKWFQCTWIIILSCVAFLLYLMFKQITNGFQQQFNSQKIHWHNTIQQIQLSLQASMNNWTKQVLVLWTSCLLGRIVTKQMFI